MTLQPFYAFTPELDESGDVALDGSTYSWGSPMVEIVKRVLRTPRGTYLPDPSFGVDYSVVDKARPDAGARFQAAILAALRPWTLRREIVDLSVAVEVTDSTLRYEISFSDPRLASDTRGRVTLRGAY